MTEGIELKYWKCPSINCISEGYSKDTNKSINDHLRRYCKQNPTKEKKPENIENKKRKIEKLRIWNCTNEGCIIEGISSNPNEKINEHLKICKYNKKVELIEIFDEKETYVFLLTGVSNSIEMVEYTKEINKLGGVILYDTSEYEEYLDKKNITFLTLLLSEFKRTEKLFFGVSNGYVLNKDFLNISIKNNKFANPMDYLYKDKNIENQYQFNMTKSVENRLKLFENNLKIFSGFEFQILINESLEILKRIIVFSGGIISLDSLNRIIIANNKKDLANLKNWEKFRIYNEEFIFSSLLNQNINFNNNLFSSNN
jgi:hypothetical protein